MWAGDGFVFGYCVGGVLVWGMGLEGMCVGYWCAGNGSMEGIVVGYCGGVLVCGLCMGMVLAAGNVYVGD